MTENPASRAVLEDIVRTGNTLLPSGAVVNVDSNIDPQCGALLQRAIRYVKPSVALEVGLAFGVSTLYMLEALEEVDASKLIGMDPAQFDAHWRGGGLHNIRRAGFESLYEFHERPSEYVLPELAARGLKVEFAFIDGWHTFDHALIDFFYIDQMLSVGGIVVFDDVGYPSIRRACDFIVTNRSYEIYDCVRLKLTNGFARRGKRVLNSWLHPMTRTDKTPDLAARRLEARIDDVYFLALRKCSDDSRRWDHFAHF